MKTQKKNTNLKQKKLFFFKVIKKKKQDINNITGVLHLVDFWIQQ
jgi:hypothetical protein